MARAPLPALLRGGQRREALPAVRLRAPARFRGHTERPHTHKSDSINLFKLNCSE